MVRDLVEQQYYHKSLEKNTILCKNPLCHILQKLRRLNCKYNKMQQWLTLQHVGCLRRQIKFHPFSFILNCQMPFIITSLSPIIISHNHSVYICRLFFLFYIFLNKNVDGEGYQIVYMNIQIHVKMIIVSKSINFESIYIDKTITKFFG